MPDHVDRVSVRIPDFCPTDPEMWFSMVERSFDASGITAEATKFGYLMSALDPRYALEVRDIIVKPPASNPYSTLKTELIRRLSASQEQKTRRLLEHEEIGDRKPSQFLRHLRSLAGTMVHDSMLRTLWLGRLPHGMQAILATQKDTALEKVAELADAIAESSNSRCAIAETSTVSSDGLLAVQFQRLATSLQQELAAVRSEIADIKNKYTFSDERHHQRYRQRSRSRGRVQNSQGFCWYHWKFGTAAKRCVQPCSFISENATGSH